jgi:hypothetical protein
VGGGCGSERRLHADGQPRIHIFHVACTYHQVSMGYIQAYIDSGSWTGSLAWLVTQQRLRLTADLAITLMNCQSLPTWIKPLIRAAERKAVGIPSSFCNSTTSAAASPCRLSTH